jgi:predicted component of type VI protein secretion system
MYKKSSLLTIVFTIMLTVCGCQASSSPTPSSIDSSEAVSVSSSAADAANSISDAGLSVESAASCASTEDSVAAASSSESASDSSSSAPASALIKNWSTKKIADGATHVLSAPVITKVTSQDDQITVTWQAVQGASQYDVSWGRADSLTQEPSFTFSSDEGTWPNDTVGSDPVQIHISAMNDQGEDSAFTDVEISLHTEKITFVFYDYANKEVKVGETESETPLPCGVQTLNVDDNTINVGPLELGQAPDGWSFRGDFTFETRPIQEGQDNSVSIFVVKQ